MARRWLVLAFLFWALPSFALDQMWYGRTDGAHPRVCVNLVDPTTGDFLQSAPADWTAGTAPAGEFRRQFNYAGTLNNTTNQGAYTAEGIACVTLATGELQQEAIIVIVRDSSGCPSSCAYLTTSVYIQTGGNPSAYHDAGQ